MSSGRATSAITRSLPPQSGQMDRSIANPLRSGTSYGALSTSSARWPSRCCRRCARRAASVICPSAVRCRGRVRFDVRGTTALRSLALAPGCGSGPVAARSRDQRIPTTNKHGLSHPADPQLLKFGHTSRIFDSETYARGKPRSRRSRRVVQRREPLRCQQQALAECPDGHCKCRAEERTTVASRAHGIAPLALFTSSRSAA
jgi:hypothetical protein